MPPYLAFMAGATMEEMEGRRQRHVLRAAAFFVLGLSTVFLILGLAASTLGRALLAWQEQLTLLAGAVIVLFGLHFLGVLRIPYLHREARFQARSEAGTALGAYLFGLAFAFGWTPCIGPVLGAILSVAVQGGSTGRGLLLMAAYAAGLGVPFLLTALFLGRAMGVMSGLKRHMATVERVTGGLLVAVGVLDAAPEALTASPSGCSKAVPPSAASADPSRQRRLQSQRQRRLSLACRLVSPIRQSTPRPCRPMTPSVCQTLSGLSAISRSSSRRTAGPKSFHPCTGSTKAPGPPITHSDTSIFGKRSG